MDLTELRTDPRYSVIFSQMEVLRVENQTLKEKVKYLEAIVDATRDRAFEDMFGRRRTPEDCL